jgi:hypothetical protein
VHGAPLLAVSGMQVHLIVAFPLGVFLDYWAERTVAEAFAADMNHWHGAALTIDWAVTATMRLLPCHQLYEA